MREPSGRYLPATKRTELGELPTDWPLVRLAQFAGGVSVGLVINPSTYFSEAGTIPMLLGSQISPNRIDHEGARRISPASNALIPASVLRAGDLVTVRVGEPGVTAVVPPDLDGCNCASMMIVRRSSRFNSHWLCHAMNSPLGMRQVANVQYGTAQKQFNIGDAVGFLFPLPSLAEQQSIASVLSDVDSLIDSLEQLLSKQRQIKEGAMQELLTGQRRLPGFSGEVVSRTYPPADWQRFQVCQIADVKTGPFGSALHERDYVQSGIPIITVEHLGEHGVEGDGAPQVSEADVQRLKAYTLFEGDIVFSRVGSVDRNARVSASQEGWLFSGRLLRLRLKQDKADSRFLSFLLHGEPFRQQVLSVAVGQTMASLNTKILNGLEVRLPSLAEQHAIAQVLTDMDLALTALQARLAKARDLKQALMQVLLTGRIRLLPPAATAAGPG